MKVPSLTEPYATLIKKGVKTIETRSWKTNYRGKLYIHASSTRIPREYKANRELMSLVDIEELSYGTNFFCRKRDGPGSDFPDGRMPYGFYRAG